MTHREHFKASYISFIKVAIKKENQLKKTWRKDWEIFPENILEMAYFLQRKCSLEDPGHVNVSGKPNNLWISHYLSFKWDHVLEEGKVIHTWINILIPKYSMKYFHFQRFDFENWKAKKIPKETRFRCLYLICCFHFYSFFM